MTTSEWYVHIYCITYVNYVSVIIVTRVAETTVKKSINNVAIAHPSCRMIKRKSTSAQLSELLTLCIGDRESYEGGGLIVSSYVGNSAELLYLVTDSNCK
ncbi:hypothetical protein MDV072.6 [Gallid alphaherpesvirus 2]|nr:hypothetical protein MDV072.6 [Gallid alphaherpesvirus 2]